ncbi:hypothetical protein [Desulfosediminicola sp.]|uniref:hypothetical protein n=1 Tax=Desulfosediminicola sp. TaxID=2886825 RepID=UPI003AF2C70E
MDQTKIIALNECTSSQARLFKTTKIMSSRLPMGRIDLLIIDTLGALTTDTRDVVESMKAHAENTNIRRIYIRDLSKGAGGNSSGVGYADFVSARVVQKTDRLKTYNASIAVSDPRIGATPIYYETDVEVLKACFKTIDEVPVRDIKLVYVKDAKYYNEIVVSPSLLKDMKNYPVPSPVDSRENIKFDEIGNIISLFQCNKGGSSMMTSVKSFLSEFFAFGY